MEESLNFNRTRRENEKEETTSLKQQKQTLEAEIKTLKQTKDRMLSQQLEVQETLSRMVKEANLEVENKRQTLQREIEQLERRRERIREEMRTSFAGVSQDLAIRVQGFKDYLVGSLQDLAAAAEQLELPSSRQWEEEQAEIEEFELPEEKVSPTPQFAVQQFEASTRQIREILEGYRTKPDYYGPPWQLRRTFESIHAEQTNNWFFTQGGRGAIRTLGSRLQNILVTSAIISVLHGIYGDRFRALVLANTPERLGEWRRGLQDCLGIARSDFGPDRGIVLFEDPMVVVQKAERLVEQNQLPLIVIDETEEFISLSLLQFPLWLAFAPDPMQMSGYTY
ncbi:MAG: DUF3086 domain-containing protein [Prochloraceae cyanobacterium]